MRAQRGSPFVLPPVAGAAGAHAAGTFAGLRLSAGAGTAAAAPGWLALGFFSLLVVIGVRLVRSRGHAGPGGPAPGGLAPLVIPPLLFVAGTIGGATAGSSALRACTATAPGGRAAIAAGVLLDRVPGLGRGGRDETPGRSPVDRASVTVGSVELVVEGRRCLTDRLRATVPRGAAALEVGSGVVLRGAWRRAGEPTMPRAPDRWGYLSASTIETAPLALRVPRGARLRGSLARRLDRRLASEDVASVARALLLADRSTLGREIRRRFVDAGIVHLLAISGLHVGMIAAGIVWMVGFIDRGPRRWIWSACVVTAYVFMIGAPPAAARAALLFWGHAACRRRDRPARIGDLAGLAALVGLGLDPHLLTDPGFQLSFAGFTGVIVGHAAGARIVEAVQRRAPRRMRRPAGWLADAVLTSTGAFLLTAPIAALHFGRVVATSIPASVASTGLVGLILPSIAATALLPEAVGRWIGGSASALIVALTALADAFAGAPLRWRVAPAAGWVAVAVGLLALGAARARRRHRRRYAAALSVALAAWLARPTVVRLASLGTPLVCTLDVGQGDAAVVRTRAGRWLVFDAGPGTSVLEGRMVDGREARLDSWMGDAGRNVIVPFLRARGAREIELLALSHPHLDHFGGSGALFDAFRIRHVLDPGVPEPSSAYLAFLERIDAERAAWIRGTAGDAFAVDDVEMTVLWPPEGAGRGANETSLSFRLEVGDFAYVNTGDAPVETERAILARAAAGAAGSDGLHADLLKLGHHGSHTSSDVRWLEAVDPAIAVASLGRDNRYGHPHAATMARLDSAGVRQVWRTDIDGTLCVEITDGGWRVVRP